MVTITAEMVKNLREKTGAGMMDCKKALTDANGSVDGAVEALRKSGILKAEKKAGRVTKEGLIFTCVDGRRAAFVEIVCETDFVARNEKFKSYGAALARQVATAFAGRDGDLTAAVAEAEKTAIVELVAVIGENMQIRRVLRWETAAGMLASYVHMGGKITVLVEAAGEAAPAVLNDACMHVAAFSPQYVGPEQVPAEVLAKEKEIAAAQVTGKPANIIDKIVAGKIAKWYTELCLMQQPWIRDDKTCLAKVAPNLQVRRFVRWQIGEAV